MKCYFELDCDNVDVIADEIYCYLEEQTDLLIDTPIGWNFIDIRQLLQAAPTLLQYFVHLNLKPRHAAITIVTETGHLPKHVDEPPVIAKINFPVRNTTGWSNKWYDGDTVIAEVIDMKKPMVFNSQIPHSVDKLTQENNTRIVASFTFYNEPLQWLK